jgi:putative transposase
MRYPASEKLEIIRLVEQSHLPVRRTLAQIRIPRSTFYRWCDQYQTGGPEALDDRSPRPDRVWNRIPDDVRARVVTLALDQPELSPRELAVRFTDVERYFVSEASVYRLLKAHDLITSPAFITMKAADEFKNKTTAPNQLWQTDFTYLKVTGWGWFYLSTILDDFSRYIIAWKLCTTMKAEDVTDTLELALQASGMDQATVMHRPRLLSDNGSSYVSGDLAKWLDRQDMRHTRGAPYHPMTQGKIERWHQTLKNRILLENYYLPGDLEAQINAFVAYYNHRRYHESIDNLTPADVYFGRGQTILLERERIKRKTIQTRRLWPVRKSVDCRTSNGVLVGSLDTGGTYEPKEAQTCCLVSSRIDIRTNDAQPTSRASRGRRAARLARCGYLRGRRCLRRQRSRRASRLRPPDDRSCPARDRHGCSVVG